MTYRRFTQQLQQRREHLEVYLRQMLATLPVIDPMLVAVTHYGVLTGGKRLRPLLLYHIGECLHVPLERLDAPAAAVECLHAYTLLHDDLPAMDNSPLRRGKPTAHIQFGEAQAILAGDALHAIAFWLLSQPSVEAEFMSANTQLAMLRELALTSHGLCHGQSLDLQANSTIALLPETLTQINYYKTALLIRCSVRLALFAAELPTAHSLTLFDQFATTLGLAFQLQDDILDITSDTAQLGKPSAQDQKAGKAYWHPANVATGKQQLQQLYQRVFSTLEQLPYNTASLKSFIHYLQKRTH